MGVTEGFLDTVCISSLSEASVVESFLPHDLAMRCTRRECLTPRKEIGEGRIVGMNREEFSYKCDAWVIGVSR